MQHHDEAIARFVSRSATRPDVIGVLLTGSLATGTERADSDVDIVLVVTDEAWSEALAAHRVMVVDREGAGYPDGYFDIKLATLSQLEAAVTRGDDPVRSSIGDARVLLDRTASLADLVRRIDNPPASPRTDRIASFVAQARLHGEYFLPQAIDRAEPFLVAHAAVHLGLAAGRAALAAAGLHYPGPKDLIGALRSVAAPGPVFADAIDHLTRRPSKEAALALLGVMEDAFGDTLNADATLSQFILDNELAWYYGAVPPEYR